MEIEEQIMELANPDLLRLVPGEGIEATFSESSHAIQQVGFFVRSVSGAAPGNGDVSIRQRGGVIKFEGVFLVLTMIKVEGDTPEFFDIWWNYHARGVAEHFRKMAQQENVTVHFYSESGKEVAVETENSFKKFFSFLPELIEKAEPWTEVEFDRAQRGLCAQSYPKENLWDMIEFRSETIDTTATHSGGIDSYPGIIPDELRPFYDYLPAQGHSIKIIPSMLEEKAMGGNPEEFLFPAPVKTVLRCGTRWAKGFPVAPIPFIPGHGLAVPPDDTEF
jgi:hypothetical protein